jgi:hypothetical protein
MPSDRYLRLIAIDLNVFALCGAVLMIGFGLWIATFYVNFSGMNLFWFILADSLLFFIGLSLAFFSIKTIMNARREYRKIIPEVKLARK